MLSTERFNHTKDEDLVSAIKKDHDHIRYLFGQFKVLDSSEDMKKIGNEIVRQLCIHSVAEELVVYPVIKEKLGESAHKEAVAEHDIMKRDLNDLFNLSEPMSNQYRKKLSDVLMDFIEHATKEEETLMPTLAGKLSKEKEEELVQEFIERRAVVPTRPHPSVSNYRMIENILCRIQAPLDKTMDKMSGNYAETSKY